MGEKLFKFVKYTIYLIFLSVVIGLIVFGMSEDNGSNNEVQNINLRPIIPAELLEKVKTETRGKMVEVESKKRQRTLKDGRKEVCYELLFGPLVDEITVANQKYNMHEVNWSICQYSNGKVEMGPFIFYRFSEMSKIAFVTTVQNLYGSSESWRNHLEEAIPQLKSDTNYYDVPMPGSLGKLGFKYMGETYGKNEHKAYHLQFPR